MRLGLEGRLFLSLALDLLLTRFGWIVLLGLHRLNGLRCVRFALHCRLLFRSGHLIFGCWLVFRVKGRSCGIRCGLIWFVGRGLRRVRWRLIRWIGCGGAGDHGHLRGGLDGIVIGLQEDGQSRSDGGGEQGQDRYRYQESTAHTRTPMPEAMQRLAPSGWLTPPALVPSL